MKKDKQISREFLSNAVEITHKIGAWFGFEIDSWSCYADEKPGTHDLAYNHISMGNEAYGDDIIIDFDAKEIFLLQKYYTFERSHAGMNDIDFSAMKHLDSKDRSALAGLAAEHGFEFSSDSQCWEPDYSKADEADVKEAADSTLQ